MKRTTPSILRFHGVRGSRPVHAPNFMNYGGNSTCIEFDAGLDFTLIIDGGSGLQHVSDKLGLHPLKKRLHILITHTHWDHILALPFIRQLSIPEFEITFHAPPIHGRPFHEIFNSLFNLGRLPIPKPNIEAKITFHSITPGSDFLVEGKIKVLPIQVNHPLTTLAYKISHGESVVAVITDIAAIHGKNYLGAGFSERAAIMGQKEFELEYNQNVHNFLKNVPNVIFDTHFNAANVKPDWGHATPELAISVCAEAGVKRLFMFHHAPEDDDSLVAQKQDHARRLALPHPLEVINAREEDEWHLISA